MDVLQIAAAQFYKENRRPDGRNFSQCSDVACEHHKRIASKMSYLRSSTTVRFGSTVVTCTAKARLVHLHPYAQPQFSDYFRITQSGLNEKETDTKLQPLSDKIAEILELAEVVDVAKLLTFTRPSGAVDIDMVESSESATCKYIWRFFVDFYIAKSDGCQLSACLIGVLAAIKGIEIPQVSINPVFICDHTGALADEVEFEFRSDENKTEICSLNVKEFHRVTIPIASVSENGIPVEFQALPFAFSFSFIPRGDEEENEFVHLIDPSGVEEALCCSTFTVVCSKDNIFTLLTSGCGFSSYIPSKLTTPSISSRDLITQLVKSSQERAGKLGVQLGFAKKG